MLRKIKRIKKITTEKIDDQRTVVHYLDIANDYQTALDICKPLNGKKYHCKRFSGGIIFNCCFESDNLNILVDQLEKVRIK